MAAPPTGWVKLTYSSTYCCFLKKLKLLLKMARLQLLDGEVLAMMRRKRQDVHGASLKRYELI